MRWTRCVEVDRIQVFHILLKIPLGHQKRLFECLDLKSQRVKRSNFRSECQQYTNNKVVGVKVIDSKSEENNNNKKRKTSN